MIDIGKEANAFASWPTQERLLALKRIIPRARVEEVLALEWEVDRGSRVLAIANGSFLLNLPLVNPARRPLAGRVAEWIGAEPRRVAFVEGPLLLGESELPPAIPGHLSLTRPDSPILTVRS